MKLWSWLRTVADFLFHRRRIESEMDEEFRSHLASRAADLERQGVPKAEAARQARIEFGGCQQYKEECREALGTRLLQELWEDLRYGLRQLRRNPGFTIVAVLTLAIGIGANTAIFSVVNDVLLKPLPFPNSSRLVMVWKEALRESFHLGATPDDFLVWKKLNHVFEDIAAFKPQTLDLIGTGQPEQVQGMLVTPGYFDTLGVTPFMGTAFLEQEENSKPEDLAVLSYSLWRRSFGSDSGVLGKAINLGGEQYVIVGIMPRGFESPKVKADLWIPLRVHRDPSGTNPEHVNLPLIARLKRGVTLQQAQANLNLLTTQLHDYLRKSGSVVNPSLVPLYDAVVGNASRVLIPLVGIVVLVLMISCATVANLMLARASTRVREMAIRSALGASRKRLIRQLLTESVLLAIIGAAFGIILAQWSLKLLIAAAPSDIPRLGEIAIDGRVLCLTLILSVIVGVVFGLAPALRGTATGNAVFRPRHLHLRSVLIGSETALSLVLLIGAGLLTNSLVRLLNVNPGFIPKNVLTMQINLPQFKYSQGQQMTRFFSRLTEQVKMLPGVQSAGVTRFLPLTRGVFQEGFNLKGGRRWTPASADEWQVREFYPVTPGYCKAMGIPLFKGRYLTEEDNEVGTPGNVVISKTIATQFFPNQNPIGRRLFFSFDKKVVPFTTVGVVGDTKRSGLGDNRLWLAKPPMGGIYMPIRKLPAAFFDSVGFRMTLVVRTIPPPINLLPAIRAEVRSMDKTVPISKIQTMESLVAESVSSRSIATSQLLLLAGMALSLALAGVYSVTAYSVAQQTREIGIRMSLGARKHQILGLVLVQNLTAVLVGIGVGTAIALAFTRVLSSQLYGISATDVSTFGAVSLFFLITAGSACYIPARRAAKVDPMVALRYE